MIRESTITLKIVWDDRKTVDPGHWDWARLLMPSNALMVSVEKPAEPQVAMEALKACFSDMAKDCEGRPGTGAPQLEFAATILEAAQKFTERSRMEGNQ